MPTVLITGTNRGLGLGLVRTYLEDGWSVISVNRNSSPELEALADHPGLQTHICDLTNDSSLGQLADHLSDTKLDVLINNAGMMPKVGQSAETRSIQGFGNFDREDWHRLFDINLFTPMHLAELFLDQLSRNGGGKLVTLSSMLGSMGLNDKGGLYAYRASKAGVNAIMRAMGIDLADKGITSIAMHPGWVRTDMGGKRADLDIQTSVDGMKQVIDGLSSSDSGRFYSYNGDEMPW